jgi:hypothetical protein
MHYLCLPLLPLFKGSAPLAGFTPPSPVDWLVELHNKLWDRRDLFDQIFRRANLTEADFIELQCLLERNDPNRNTASYVAQDVIAIKSQFLSSRSYASFTTSHSHLVPQLIVDTSKNLTQPMAVDPIAVDTEDIGTEGDAMDLDPDPDSKIPPYIAADANYLSKGPNPIFPITIQYMNLNFLKLQLLERVPHLMLVRSEWTELVEIFNNRQKGIRGGAIFTGQPGIGKNVFVLEVGL